MKYFFLKISEIFLFFKFLIYFFVNYFNIIIAKANNIIANIFAKQIIIIIIIFHRCKSFILPYRLIL